jgi:hypothetical protein
VGVKVEYLELGMVGVKGNDYMIFMELNGEEISEKVWSWLKAK